MPAPDHGPDGPWEVGRLQATWWDEPRRPPKPVVGSEPSPVPAAPRGSPVELPRLTRGAAVPGRLLSSVPGKVSKAALGSQEQVLTCPHLSEDPGWCSQNNSKLGAGRQKSGNGVPPSQGLRFLLRSSCPRPLLWGAGALRVIGPGHSQPHISEAQGASIVRLRRGLGWTGATGCGRLTTTASDPGRGHGVGSRHTCPPHPKTKVMLPTRGRRERGRTEKIPVGWGSHRRFECRRWRQITEARPRPPAS